MKRRSRPRIVLGEHLTGDGFPQSVGGLVNRIGETPNTRGYSIIDYLGVTHL
jgi:hypothetical protein